MIEKIKIESTGEVFDIAKMTNVTYSELKALRDGGQLVAGHQYRITDYVATTSDPLSESRNYQFDIIVIADNECTLNENARAIKHEGESEDPRVDTRVFEAWEIKYSLDNDVERFEWAQAYTVNYILDATTAMQIVLDEGITLVSSNDTTYEGYPYKFQNEYAGVMYSPSETFSTMTTVKSVEYGDVPIDSLTKVETPEGKGVIYRMKDEFGNESTFDFYSIVVTARKANSSNTGFLYCNSLGEPACVNSYVANTDTRKLPHNVIDGIHSMQSPITVHIIGDNNHITCFTYIRFVELINCNTCDFGTISMEIIKAYNCSSLSVNPVTSVRTLYLLNCNSTNLTSLDKDVSIVINNSEITTV